MINEIREPLKRLQKALPGCFAATVMGFDGLAVDTIEGPQDQFDITTLMVEYTELLKQAKSSAQMFAAGELEEVSLRSKELAAVIRPINADYFLAVALPARSSNQGKARYLLRVTAPGLAKVLS